MNSEIHRMPTLDTHVSFRPSFRHGIMVSYIYTHMYVLLWCSSITVGAGLYAVIYPHFGLLIFLDFFSPHAWVRALRQALPLLGNGRGEAEAGTRGQFQFSIVTP